MPQKIGILVAVLFALLLVCPSGAFATVYPPGTQLPSGTYIHPTVTCSSNQTPVMSDGVGLEIEAANVKLINPEISGCAKAIVDRAENLIVQGNPDRAGYDQLNQIHNNRYGIVLDKGQTNPTIRAINGGKLFLRNNYRPITVQTCGDAPGWISHTEISHPMSGNVWPNSAYDKGVVGIKFLHDYGTESTADRSCHDWTVTKNTLAPNSFREEGISLDGNAGSGPPRDSVIQGTTTVDHVSGDTVYLTGKPRLTPAQGGWLNYLNADSMGEYDKIVSVDNEAKSITLASRRQLSSGDTVSISGGYRNIQITKNTVDETGALTGIAAAQGSYHVAIRGNTITGDPIDNAYSNTHNLRPTPNGQADQSIRVSSVGASNCGTITPHAPGTKPCQGTASFVSVTGNTVSHDISFHQKIAQPLSGILNYWVGNTFTSGGQLWNDGTNVKLATDPNP